MLTQSSMTASLYWKHTWTTDISCPASPILPRCRFPSSNRRQVYYVNWCVICLMSHSESPLGSQMRLLQMRNRTKELRQNSEESRVQSTEIQKISIRPFPGLVNFVPAFAFLFCLNMPAAFSQPGNGLIEIPCTSLVLDYRHVYYTLRKNLIAIYDRCEQ